MGCPHSKKNRKMIGCYLRENNLMHFLKMIFPLNREEKTINARQNYKTGTTSWLDQVQWQPSNGRSIRPQELIMLENSNITEDNLPPDDVSYGDLTIIKSPPKHDGMSH